MKIRVVRDLVPSEDYYTLRLLFDEFSDEEKYLFNKYGFIKVFLPNTQIEFIDDKKTVRTAVHGDYTIDYIPKYKFLFRDKQSLINFQKRIIEEIQGKIKKYIEEIESFAGEEIYEVTTTGEIRKINEGAKKTIDKNSREYKEIIEKNREAFEKLSKL